MTALFKTRNRNRNISSNRPLIIKGWTTLYKKSIIWF